MGGGQHQGVEGTVIRSIGMEVEAVQEVNDDVLMKGFGEAVE
jgi:hypothetical protein